MMKRPIIRLVPLGDIEQFKSVCYQADALSLRELLARVPALSTKPIEEPLMDRLVQNLAIGIVEEPWEIPLYRPPGLRVAANDADESEPTTLSIHNTRVPALAGTVEIEESIQLKDNSAKTETHPTVVSEVDAVRWAYAREIERVASFLRAGLSVLVVCDKLVVEHLWRDMALKARLEPQELTVPTEDDSGLMPRGLRQRQLARLKELIKDLKEGQVLVIPHLDLLAGGSDSTLPTESRELIELLYESSQRLMLAFADRSLDIPEVLATRFAVRILISGVWRTVIYPNGDERLLGQALVTADEAALFRGFDAEGLYKNVAGMNPVQIRHAIKYAVKEHKDEQNVPVTKLYEEIRSFKAQTSAKFEVPDVSFKDIGGYEDVKAELTRAIRLMTGSYNLPDEKLRHELIPHGFIFHGPPGTGKTLFAKAIANMLNATIQVVSGPEVTDMYVGESERKVRELFAEARRNAPAVLVFDEFDSIATKRSGRDDGGSRAGNALVAQILTEMDGFRPDVPMLVIGTTNRLDIIDAALLRPSRFKPVAISLPDAAARRAIALVHSNHFGISVSDELLWLIGSATEGMNGDDIQSLFRDACVGLYCEDLPIVADAHRFGMLVGRLRRAQQDMQTAVAAQRSTAIQTGREPPRPATAMTTLRPPMLLPIVPEANTNTERLPAPSGTAATIVEGVG
jgi:transitional endoplasmic reticulum ATPase